VQGAIEAGLARIMRTPAHLTAAGRTDAGVHATGQVAHVDVPIPAWVGIGESLPRRLAGVLDADIRVAAARPAPAGFDARFSARWRRYSYRVVDSPASANPLRRRDTLCWPRRLHLDAMNTAGAALLGEHDFVAFCRRRVGASTRRELQDLHWSRDDDGVAVATVTANAFCHQMVRSLVGALLCVGDGRRPADWPASMLSATRRADSIAVAAAHGLTLVAVGYPDRFAF